MFRVLGISCLFCLSASHANTLLPIKSGVQQVAVVELFTSEGCRSDPPADQWLAALVETPVTASTPVLALSFLE